MRLLSVLSLCLPVLVRASPGDDRAVAIPAYANDSPYWHNVAKKKGKSICIVLPSRNGDDDAPAIMNALNKECQKNSLVVFPGPVYNIQTNMTTVDMKNVEIHHFGRFLWSTDIDYWLSVSMPVGFQNQSTVWYFGGDRVTLDGHGSGVFDGNGQVWYDWAKNGSNLPRRPMNINWRTLTNSAIRNMRFVQSQMWTMATTWTHNVEFDDIYVNNTSTSKWGTINTDGIDTIYSSNITLRRWSITCGDDGVTLKRNSSNVRLYDSTLYGASGIAMGSIAQHNGEYDFIDGFYAHNITLYDTTHALYVKTWSGTSMGYPPNGGGGGIGRMNNVVVEDLRLAGTRSYPFYAWQCENYEGNAGKECQTSKFHMDGFTAKGISGWANKGNGYAGWFECSAGAGGCHDYSVSDFDVKNGEGGEKLDKWYCENMHEHSGFTCSGKPE